MKTKLAILLLLLPSWAAAQEIRFAPGATVQAAVTLVADENGVLQIDRSKPILIGSLQPTVNPVTPDPVVPSDPLPSRVSALAEQAPKQTALERKAIAELFKTVGNLPLSDPAQMRQATTILFDALTMPQTWKDWKAKVDTFASGLSVADTKRAWQLISEALGK